VRKKREAMAHLENIIFILLLVHVLNSTTPFFFNFYVIPPEHSQVKKNVFLLTLPMLMFKLKILVLYN
jgi:hypothetical protein